MSEDEKIIMVCVAVNECTKPVADSMVTNCMQCGQGVWISPISLIEQPTAEPLCLSCAAETITAPDAKLMEPSPAQLRELAKEMMRERDED